jgi:hypothetical protein
MIATVLSRCNAQVATEGIAERCRGFIADLGSDSLR